MIKLIKKLENSDKVQDRNLYSQSVKKIIKESQYLMGVCAKMELPLPEDYKKNLSNLKNKMSNYDVYRQKISCETCKEVQCICGEVLSLEKELNKIF